MGTLIETTNAAAAYDTLSSLYGVRRLTAPGKRPRLRVTQDRIGPASLHRLTFGMDCDLDGGPRDALFLGYLGAGHIAYQYGHRAPASPAYGVGDVFLAMEPGVAFHADISGADLHYAALGLPLLAEVADRNDARRERPIRFTAYQPATPADARLWLRTHRFVRDQLRAADAAGPLVAGASARLLAATALSVFPNDALAEPTAEDRHDAHPATVRRAVGFIEDNAHRDISPADIAAAAYVTIRALQLAFRRHLGTTPTAYLRRIRLEHARHQLSEADPGHETVTAVAHQWGFSSSSRFAARYRKAYGVMPSETLRD